MFSVDTTTNKITISKGDTGAFRITATGHTFSAEDRCVFTIKSRDGKLVKRVAYPMTDNAFVVTLFNADTDKLAAGDYVWDARYVIHPYYDEEGNVIDGDQVITPNLPMDLNLLTVVGDI